MKKTSWIQLVGMVLLSGGLFVMPAAAGTFDHGVGLSYLSGFADVVDFYDDIPYAYQETDTIPVGLSYRGTANFDSGLRVDVGIGPVAVVLGDYSYWDIPLQLTGGFSFFPNHSVRPYLRGGVTVHVADGDYMTKDPGVGLLGAVGLEIGKRGRISGFLEVSHDTAEATFEYSPFHREKIKVHGTVVSLGVLF